MRIVAIVYVSVILVLSLVTFVVYGIDKRQAKKAGRRISEALLHWLALLGGWPGAWAGQQFFRHKTQKLAYRVIFWAIVVTIYTIGLIVIAWMIVMWSYRQIFG